MLAALGADDLARADRPKHLRAFVGALLVVEALAELTTIRKVLTTPPTQ